MYYTLTLKNIPYWQIENKNNKRIYKKEILTKPFELYLYNLNISNNNINYFIDIITNKIIGLRMKENNIELVPGKNSINKENIEITQNVSINYMNTFINNKEKYEQISNSILQDSFYCDLLSQMYDIDEIPYQEVMKEIQEDNNQNNKKLNLILSKK